MPSADGALSERLGAEIASSGPIGFDRFMEVALYDPDAGYFATGALRSDRGGDFLTSPEVSPLFGSTLGRFVAGEYARIGEPFHLVEVGGGSGSLLEPLLGALAWTPPVVAVERSTAARESIASRIRGIEFADAPALRRGVAIANELLDNMPAALVVRRGDHWVERRVDVVDDRFVFVEQTPRPDVVEWADRFSGRVPEGGMVEVQIEASEWVRAVVGGLEAGSVLLVDYGDTADGLESRRTEGTVRTYRGHHLGPDPLAAPGLTDITMDVNLTAVVVVAHEAGATDVEVHRQDDFLVGLGLRDRITELHEEELIAAREGRVPDQLVLKSRITGAETLLHPRGLGDFRVVEIRK